MLWFWKPFLRKKLQEKKIDEGERIYKLTIVSHRNERLSRFGLSEVCKFSKHFKLATYMHPCLHTYMHSTKLETFLGNGLGTSIHFDNFFKPIKASIDFAVQSDELILC
jgi:hypothetical protein